MIILNRIYHALLTFLQNNPSFFMGNNLGQLEILVHVNYAAAFPMEHWSIFHWDLILIRGIHVSSIPASRLHWSDSPQLSWWTCLACSVWHPGRTVWIGSAASWWQVPAHLNLETIQRKYQHISQTGENIMKRQGKTSPDVSNMTTMVYMKEVCY